MTIARAQIVDPSVTRWYHCVTRCVRRAFLLGEEGVRPQRLDRTAARGTCGNLRGGRRRVCDPGQPSAPAGAARSGCRQRLVGRGGRAALGTPLSASRQDRDSRSPVSDEWVQARLKDAGWVATARQRLQSLSWFMKCLKEPLSRLANRQEQTRGAFFEGRFKSVAILDEESLLATCAYIDLNPVAAGIAEVPEASAHTSIKQRVEHVQEQGRDRGSEGRPGRQRRGLDVRRRAWKRGSGSVRSRIDARLDSAREGMIEGFSLGNYLLLVDYTGRLFREGKAVISARAGRDLRAAGEQRRELAGAIAEAGGKAGCWAVSSPPAEPGCGKSPSAWACTTWRTWAAARRDRVTRPDRASQ